MILLDGPFPPLLEVKPAPRTVQKNEEEITHDMMVNLVKLGSVLGAGFNSKVSTYLLALSRRDTIAAPVYSVPTLYATPSKLPLFEGHAETARRLCQSTVVVCTGTTHFDLIAANETSRVIRAFLELVTHATKRCATGSKEHQT